MKINQTPLRTSRNYLINNFGVPDDTFSQKVKKCKITTTESEFELEANGSKQQNPLCNAQAKQLEAPNTDFKIVFDKTTQKRTNIYHNFNKDNNQLAGNICLVAEKDVQANVLIFSKSSVAAFINSFVKIECKENSNLNITLLSDHKKTQNFVNIEANLGKNACCTLNIVDFCDNLTVLRQSTNLVGPDANFDVNMLYLGTKKATFDINIISNVFGKNCKTNITSTGALFDTAQKNFKGTIDFKQGSAKSFGAENELCLLFSNQAKSKALPMLLCGEEDVDGSHSSATSKIDEKQLFYLMSRGLSKLDSMKLFLKAKFNNILSKTDKDIQKYVNNQIDRKLKNYE